MDSYIKHKKDCKFIQTKTFLYLLIRGLKMVKFANWRTIFILVCIQKSIIIQSLFILLCTFFQNTYGQSYKTYFDSLFKDVQLSEVFIDQKKFPDCIPLYPIDIIIQEYNQQKDKRDFNLKLFIADHFDTILIDTLYIFKHIDLLWEHLTRQPDKIDKPSTLINLPYPYIVPGGRFREIYYWDSYFTMLGLQVAGKTEIIQNMIDNFSYLIKQYGHIPNGNRTYYLSRSQPPFFALMIDLLAKEKGDSIYIRYLPSLQMEYNFWMNGLKQQNKSIVSKKVVFLNNGAILNRYFDNLCKPRPESYKYDYNIMKKSGRDSTIYRELRTAAESGWDFSNRWFSNNLTDIHTTDFIPIDLNCLLYIAETILAKSYDLKGIDNLREYYNEKAKQRAESINKYCYSDKKGYYFDYNFRDKKISDCYSLAGVYPLFAGISDDKQALKVSKVIQKKFLHDGGVVTSLKKTGQQWDYPNGWPPLQWITFKALKNYGYDELANKMAKRWLDLNIKVFFETGKMMEKYNVIDTNIPGGGGEYALQDGFGWTNGVFLKLWEEVYGEY